MNWNMSLLPVEAQTHPAPQEAHHHAEAAPAGNEALPADCLLIDVRSYAEYMAGHLPNAHCLPLPQMAHLLRQMAPDRDAPIVLYCASGARAEQALGLLQGMGYKHVINGGGAIALSKKLGTRIEH